MKEKMTCYKIFRAILGPIYRFWYHPVIIGKENIPEEGPILLVGNHIHIMDQCNIVIETKRCIHYMAKREYFDNKKVAWFFKASGCISVDRSRKDTDATSKALEVLKNKHAIGLFPEGTRNGLKEEMIQKIFDEYFTDDNIQYSDFKKKVKKNKTSQVNYLEELLKEKKITLEEWKENIYHVDDFLNELISKKVITEQNYYDHILLPLKFGAVSMAHKTDALLVPYAITGEYKFHSKNLMIRIGKPFKVNDNLEKANEKLDKEIKKLLKENLKSSVKM